MVRVIDRSASNAKLVVEQGAPGNEVVRLLNQCCVPLSTTTSRQPDHQGYLLHTAMQVFKETGLVDMEVKQRHEKLTYSKATGLDEACKEEAERIVMKWYGEDAARGKVKEHLVVELRKTLARQMENKELNFKVDCSSVVVTATPVKQTNGF